MEENYLSRNTNNDSPNVEKLCIYYVISAYYNLIKNNCLLFPHRRERNSVSDKEINNNFADAKLMFSKARQWPEGGVWIRGSHLVIQEWWLDGRPWEGKYGNCQKARGPGETLRRVEISHNYSNCVSTVSPGTREVLSGSVGRTRVPLCKGRCKQFAWKENEGTK